MGGRIQAGRLCIRIVAAVTALLMPGAFGSVVNAGFEVTADVTVTKDDGVVVVDAGGTVTYTIIVSNAGPDAVAPTVTDPMPAELASMEWTCAAAGSAGAFGAGTGSLEDFPNLPIGGSVTYTVTGTVRFDATGTLANTASVIGAFNDPNPGDNAATDTDSITPMSTDLSIVKSPASSVVAGQPVTYDVAVDNLGPNSRRQPSSTRCPPSSATRVGRALRRRVRRARPRPARVSSTSRLRSALVRLSISS